MFIRADGQTSIFSQWTGHVSQTPIVGLNWSVPHKLRVRVFGNHHMAWFDNQKVIDFFDNSEFAKNTGGSIYLTPTDAGPYPLKWDDLKIASGALLPTATSVGSVAAAKAQPLGTQISLAGAEVTKAYNGFFYIEDTSRASGIRVVSSTSVQPGSRVQIVGTTAKEGEEIKIVASSVSGTTGTPTIRSLGMTNRSANSTAEPSTVGLLVRVWGRVTQDPVQSSGYILIDDGNGSEFKMKLEFDYSTYQYPVKGAFVEVTGVHGATAGNVVHVSNASDVVKIAL